MDQLRISAKNLGQLTLPSFCPRCFWIKMHMKFKLPYQIFPGIFSSIDSYSKKITNHYFAKHGSLPKWLGGFNLSEPIKAPSLRNFHTVYSEMNIKMTGVPDEMFLRNDGSYLIADYKTARYTEHQDELLPMYEVQLNGYACIVEDIGYNPVTGLILVYYEPFTDIEPYEIDEYLDTEKFSLHFSAHLLEINQNRDMIPELLKKARKIHDTAVPPDSKSGARIVRLFRKSLTHFKWDKCPS